MPLRKVYSPTSAQQPAQESGPSLWDRIGGLPGVIGGGIRAISGAAASEGGPTGALIGGAGEAAAELAEGSAFRPATLDPNTTVGKLQSLFAPGAEDSPTVAKLKGFAQGALTPVGRIATEASLSAVPFSSVLKEGRPLISAARGAAYSGVGEAGREFATGRPIDPGAIGTAAATGGLITGGLSKLFGKPAEKAEEFVVEPTGRGGVFEKGKLKTELPPRPIRTPEGAKPIETQPAIGERVRQSTPIPYRYEEPLTKGAAKTAALEEARDKKNLAAVEKWLEQKRASEQIAKAREGLVPQPPSVSESVSAPIPGGRERMTTRYAPPTEEESDLGALGKVLGAPSKGGKKVISTEKLSEAPPADAGKAREIYEAWIAKGVPEANAVKLAAQGIPPRDIAPATRFEQGAAVAQTKPTAKYVFDQPGVGPMFNVEGGPSHGSTLSAEGLQAAGIEVPPVATVTKHPRSIREEQLNAPLPPVTPESVEAAKTAAAEELARHEEIVRKATGEEAAQTARAGFKAVPPSPAIEQAKATFPDEVNAELDRLGDQYRSMSAGPERREIGKQMAEIRDFMSGKKMRESWRGAPPAEPTAAPAVSPAVEAPVAPEVPQAAAPVVPGGPDVPAVPARQNYEERLGKLDELLNLLKGQRSGPGNPERGAIDPALLAKLGLGLGGAAIGAAVDPLNNRLQSAILGGAAGVGATYLPQMLSEIGTPSEVIKGLAGQLRTPEGINQAATNVWHTLPQIQRFNYLMDVHGLPANALFGPYGSATFGALEHAFSGDARGSVALRELADPMNFVRELKTSFQEAKDLINRSESRWSETGPANDFERLMAVPGTAMTAGDVAARRILERAGFSEDEARRITLTSEPELLPFKRAANFTKGSPFLQALAPFTRTPANIGEQGLQRFPGLGFLIQAQRETPDPMKQQLVQQALSLGVGGASGVLGANLDPETAKTVRRYVSNFGGQYSLPASIGFAAGQSLRAGKPALSPTTVGTAVDVLPLPTIQPLQEWIKFLSGQGPLPRGAVPSFVREAMSTPASAAPRPLPRLRRQ